MDKVYIHYKYDSFHYYWITETSENPYKTVYRAREGAAWCGSGSWNWWVRQKAKRAAKKMVKGKLVRQDKPLEYPRSNNNKIK